MDLVLRFRLAAVESVKLDRHHDATLNFVALALVSSRGSKLDLLARQFEQRSMESSSKERKPN